MTRYLIFGALVLFLSFAATGGIARWLNRLDRPASIVEPPETVPPAACVLCERKPPQVGLVYDIGFWWCADYAACKRHRDERAEVAG